MLCFELGRTAFFIPAAGEDPCESKSSAQQPVAVFPNGIVPAAIAAFFAKAARIFSLARKPKSPFLLSGFLRMVPRGRISRFACPNQRHARVGSAFRRNLSHRRRLPLFCRRRFRHGPAASP